MLILIWNDDHPWDKEDYMCQVTRWEMSVNRVFPVYESCLSYVTFTSAFLSANRFCVWKQAAQFWVKLVSAKNELSCLSLKTMRTPGCAVQEIITAADLFNGSILMTTEQTPIRWSTLLNMIESLSCYKTMSLLLSSTPKHRITTR